MNDNLSTGHTPRKILLSGFCTGTNIASIINRHIYDDMAIRQGTLIGEGVAGSVCTAGVPAGTLEKLTEMGATATVIGGTSARVAIGGGCLHTRSLGSDDSVLRSNLAQVNHRD